MRRTLLGLVTALALAAGPALVAAPAEAAPKPVMIKKITTRSINWHGTALVKPNVKKAKQVTVLRKTITIRQGDQVVRKDRTAVKLKPGTYRVTTKVVFRFKGKTRVHTAMQALVVRQGRCSTLADYRSIKVNVTAGAGDAARTVAVKLRNSGVLLSELTGDITLGELRDEMAAEEPEAAAAFDDLIAAYGEDALFDVGIHAICQDKFRSVLIVYIDGHAVEKSVEGS
jgi:hypothetical protein